jgi:hypothetical protein
LAAIRAERAAKKSCEVMKEEMKSGDVIMGDLDNCRGAALTIRYQLPRVEKIVAATGAHPDTESIRRQ